MQDKEIRKMSLNEDTMKMIYFTPEAHELIMARAKEEGLAAYKYILMVSNLYEIESKERGYKSKGYKSL